MTEQPLLRLEPEHSGTRAGGDDHRTRPVLGFTDPDAERAAREVDAVDVGGEELRAEAGRLLAELHHELGAHDAVGEAGEFLDVGGQHELAAGAHPLDDDWVEVRPGGVDSGSQARGARSDDDDIVNVRHEEVLSLREVRRVQHNAPAMTRIPPVHR